MAKILTTQEEKRFLNLEQEEVNISKRISLFERQFNEISAKVAKAEEQLMNIEIKGKQIIKIAEAKSEELLKSAQAKMKHADIVFSEANVKMENAKQLQEKSEDIIKSNENKEKNLDLAKKENEALKIRLSNISKSIIEALK